MSTATILAIDLGKFKSVACAYPNGGGRGPTPARWRSAGRADPGQSLLLTAVPPGSGRLVEVAREPVAGVGRGGGVAVAVGCGLGLLRRWHRHCRWGGEQLSQRGERCQRRQIHPVSLLLTL